MKQRKTRTYFKFREYFLHTDTVCTHDIAIKLPRGSTIRRGPNRIKQVRFLLFKEWYLWYPRCECTGGSGLDFIGILLCVLVCEDWHQMYPLHTAIAWKCNVVFGGVCFFTSRSFYKGIHIDMYKLFVFWYEIFVAINSDLYQPARLYRHCWSICFNILKSHMVYIPKCFGMARTLRRRQMNIW